MCRHRHCRCRPAITRGQSSYLALIVFVFLSVGMVMYVAGC